MEQTNDLIFILNQNIEIEYINESAFKNLLGYLRNELIGKSPIKFIHLTDQKIAHSIFNGNPQENADFIKLRIKDKNDNYHWYEFKRKIFIDHVDKQKLLIVARKITKVENLDESLNVTDEIFRTIAEQWLMGICIIQENQVKYLNQQLADLLGYTTEEILSWQPGEFFKTIHPDDRQMVLEKGKMRDNGLNLGIRNYVSRGVHKSGRIIWTEVWFKSIEYEGRRAFLNTFIDITDKKISEEKLKESEEKYRLITESANDLIRVMDDRFELEYINENVHKRLLGYVKEDLIGQTNLPFLHPEDRRHVIRSTLRNLNRGYGSYQARFKDKNGNYKWFEFGGKIFYDNKGTKKILSIARDINERKSVEQRLIESEKKYRHLFDNSPFFIGLVDMNGNLIDCNMTINEFMSLHNKENVIGKSFRDILSLNEKNKYLMPVFSKFFIEAIKGNKVEPYEFELFRSMNDSLWLRIEGSLIELNNKKMLQFIIQDITERKQAEIALQQAAHHWAITFDAMSDSVILLDLENRIVQCNKATLEILGKSNYHGIIDRPCWEIVHSTSEPVDWCPVKRMKISGETESSISQIGDKWFKISANPIFDDESRLSGAVHVISDITERKKAEEKLIKSEEKYRDLVNSISDLLLEVDLKGKFTYASPQLYDMFGFTFDEIRGKQIHKFIHPEDLPRVAKTLKESFETRSNMSVEYRTLHKDGHYVYASAKGAYMDNGRFYGVVRDISDTKLAEQKLKESEEKYRLISENAYDLIGIFNTKLKYEYINEQAFKRDLGYTKKDIIGKSALQFIHPEDLELTANIFKDGFQTGYGSAELRFKHKDGHWIWIDAKGRTFIDNSGELKALVLSRNISERKIAEQKLKNSEEKYRLITENANDMISITNKDSILEFVNESVHQRYLGYLKDEIIGTSRIKDIHPQDTQDLIAYAEELREKGESMTELRFRKKDGKYIWLQMKGKNFLDVDGKEKTLGVSRDITDRKKIEQKLKESEKRYRIITDNSKEAVFIMDMNLNQTFASPASYEMLGYTPEELMGMSTQKTTTPASIKVLAEIYKEELAIEKQDDKDLKRSRRVEIQQIHKNGNIIDVEISMTFLRDDVNKAIGIIGLSRNISARKRAERKLKESEERYRLISENAKDIIWTVDMNLKFTYISPTCIKLLGYTDEESINLGFHKFTTPDSITILIDAFKEEFELEKQGIENKDRVRKIEIQQIHKNGSIVDVELIITWLRDENDKAIGLIGITRDISERKEAERKLKESEERYRLISENANDVIWTTDMSMNLTYVSPSTQNASGYSVEEMLNMKIDQYHTPASFKILIDKFKEELKIERRKDKDLNRIRAFEVEQIHKNGSIINKEIIVTFLRDESQKAIGTVGVTRDITEKKEAERKVKESEEKYRKAYNRANYYKDLFAHDINNILQTINSSAELMRHYLSDSEKNKDVNAISKIINKQVMRGAKLITNIHTLSNLEDQDLSVEPIKINNQLKNSIDYIKKVYIDRDIDIQIHSPNEDFMVQANFLMQQAFDNLLSNAVKYNSNENLEISIDISKIIIEDVKYIKLEFKDNGIGVADERKDLIFKKYERANKGGKGMGVGLSLVKKIIKNYKGKIWVEDKVKGDHTKGSNFIILIPEADKVN